MSKLRTKEARFNRCFTSMSLHKHFRLSTEQLETHATAEPLRAGALHPRNHAWRHSSVYAGAVPLQLLEARHQVDAARYRSLLSGVLLCNTQ